MVIVLPSTAHAATAPPARDRFIASHSISTPGVTLLEDFCTPRSLVNHHQKFL